MVGKILAAAGTAVAGAIVAGTALRRKVREKSAKPRVPEPRGVLVCGVSGAGKSSLINDILGGEFTRAGSGGEVTQGIVSCRSGGIFIRDTQGYSSGSFGSYLDWLGEVISANPPREVWYCVNAGGKRFGTTDEQCVHALVELVGSERLHIVLTKIDLVSAEELKELRRVISYCAPGIPLVNYSVKEHGSSFYREYVEKNRQRLIRRAEEAGMEVTE